MTRLRIETLRASADEAVCASAHVKAEHCTPTDARSPAITAGSYDVALAVLAVWPPGGMPGWHSSRTSTM